LLCRQLLPGHAFGQEISATAAAARGRLARLHFYRYIADTIVRIFPASPDREDV